MEPYKDYEDEASEKATPVDRNMSPTWSDVMKKWNHPPAGSCTCGCGGGWSSTDTSLIE